MTDDTKSATPGNSSRKRFIATRVLIGVGLIGVGVLGTIGSYEGVYQNAYEGLSSLVPSDSEDDESTIRIKSPEVAANAEPTNLANDIKAAYDDVKSADDASASPSFPAYSSPASSIDTKVASASADVSSAPRMLSVADLPSKKALLDSYVKSNYFRKMLDKDNALVLDKSMTHDIPTLTQLVLSNFERYIGDTYSIPLTENYRLDVISAVNKAMVAKVAKTDYAPDKFYAFDKDYVIVDRDSAKPVDTVVLKFK